VNTTRKHSQSENPDPHGRFPGTFPTTGLPTDPQQAVEHAREWIRSSQPKPRTPLGGATLLAAVGLTAALFASSIRGSPASILLMLVPLTLLVLLFRFHKRHLERTRAEIRSTEQLEELVQLRRWPEALNLAAQLLQRPCINPDARSSILLSLSAILVRYHWFEAARIVHDHLLDPQTNPSPADPSTAHTILVARGMTMLRDDHLVDADKLMGELKRDVNRARDAARKAHQLRENERQAMPHTNHPTQLGTSPFEESAIDEAIPYKPADIDSAGLALLEIYRDIKTGHYAEAIAEFDARQKPMRQQLGHRVADGWVLVAKAHDALGQNHEAANAYRRATLLCPAIELHRRYPETASLAQTYPAAQTPDGFTISPRIVMDTSMATSTTTSGGAR
jgi:tetratricopeptide (TPR) repeat protein